MTPAAGRRETVAVMVESDGPGGAEYMLLQLGEELERRGYQVCPVLPDRGCGWLADECRARGFAPESFSLRRPLDWHCVRGMVDLFRRRQVDIVHSHEFTMAIYGAAAARWAGKPHVITMHGGQRVLSHWRRRMAFRWAMRRSGAVVTVSDATRKQFAEALRLPAEAMTVVHNGIATPPRGDPSSIPRELRLPQNDLLVVSVGNLYPVKGHAVLLQALAELAKREDVPRWQFAIAGRGPESDPLEQFAAEHGLASRVHLLGYRSDVADILAAADVWVMPSLSEGLPLALLEAMFAGKAIVASAVGGIPEVVAADQHALLVPPQNPEALAAALARLLQQPGLRESLGEAARKRATAEFSVTHMTDAYERLYGKAG